MELLDILKDNDVTEYRKTNNFYFEKHNCNDEIVKVNLDYTLSYYLTDKILRFGICPQCKVCFYNYDYKSGGM